MDKTFDDFFEEGQSYCIKCNYPKAYECFVNALKINFDVLEEIDKHDLSCIDIDYEKIGRNRQAEADSIREELNVVNEYNVAFDEVWH